ncbi:hypothetical protein [Phytomonospora endophytica]|uniref:Uncharacterized protein n=1 Tax=Phytomonospora endophytica TaxID=714109 RepID=A0A841FTD1_9ACTN|nr:hypothetical protein [Phytomonospora endophytica]MBB6036998.1 hypothetical protein [Phytomonospora endophytica]GIG69458.1 hypothetical protein Pen01_57530 [Phytomonospora endophytica]
MTRAHLDLAARLRRIARLAREAAVPHAERTEPGAVLAFDRLVGAADDADRAARVVGSGARRWHGVAARYGAMALAATIVVLLPFGGAPGWVRCAAAVFAGLAAGRLAAAAYRKLRRRRGNRVPPLLWTRSPEPLADLRTSLVDVRSDLPAKTARIPLRPLDRGDSTNVGELLAHAETSVCQAVLALDDKDWDTGRHRFPDSAEHHDHEGCALAVASGRVSRSLRPVLWALLALDTTRQQVAHAVGRLATARDLMLQSATRLDHPPPRGFSPAVRDVVTVCCGLAATVAAWSVTGSAFAIVAALLAASCLVDAATRRATRPAALDPETAEDRCAELAGVITELGEGGATSAATAAARRNAQVAADFVYDAVVDLTTLTVGFKPNQG